MLKGGFERKKQTPLHWRLREYQRTDVLQELQVCKALDSARTGKASATKLLLYSRLSLSVHTRVQRLNNYTFKFASLPAISQATDVTVSYHDDLASTWQSFLTCRDSVTIFRNTTLCLCSMLASSFSAFIASCIWKVAWENWLQSHLKAMYGGFGGA